MRGKTAFLALVAVLTMICATAVAFANGDRVPGTKEADELTLFGGDDKVYARGGDDTVEGGAGDDRIRGGRGDDALFGGDGDDRVKGGQDNDYLDGGDGDDVINGRGDGDKDKIVCGPGYDVALLGRNDVAEDDECEKLKRPKGKDPAEKRPCASESSRGCDEPEPCAARTMSDCDDPVVEEPEPEPDEPVEEPEPDTP